jgi:hypothetical protein
LGGDGGGPSDTDDVPRWECEFYSFDFPFGVSTRKELNEQTLISLTTAGERGEGLLWRVAKGPSEPPRLTPQQRREVRARFKEGEPAGNIARAYGIDADTVKQLGR